jgi:hypothetical protein
VENVDDLDPVTSNSINDSIGSLDKLADILAPSMWNHAPGERKSCKLVTPT